MTREEAKEILKEMTLEECIGMSNEIDERQGFVFSKIHEMDDREWWSTLFRKFANYELVGDQVE